MPWRRWVQAPLEGVAIDRSGAGNLALRRPLIGRSDVDEQSPGGQLLRGASRLDTHEPRPCPLEELISVQRHGDAFSLAVYGVAGAAASTATRGGSKIG